MCPLYHIIQISMSCLMLFTVRCKSNSVNALSIEVPSSIQKL